MKNLIYVSILSVYSYCPRGGSTTVCEKPNSTIIYAIITTLIWLNVCDLKLINLNFYNSIVQCSNQFKNRFFFYENNYL